MRALVCKVDVDAARATAQRFGIESIPTLIVFRNGTPVKTFVGVTQAVQPIAAVASALAGPP